MECNRFSPIDSFPVCCSKNKRFLMYYTIRSTRITIVSFGSRYILLYAEKKKIKSYILPERVTCMTVISTPRRSSDAKADGKVLLCGTCQGSVFALDLPSTKEEVKKITAEVERVAGNRGDIVLVYKYAELNTFCIACIGERLLLMGTDESGARSLFLFYTSVLENALGSLNAGFKKTPCASPPYQAVPFVAPSVTAADTSAIPDVVVFQAEHTRANPYYNSLNCLQYLEKELFCSLFRIKTGDAFGPVACFFYPGGEVWYRTLWGDVVPRKDLEYLCALGESCSVVATALLRKSYLETHQGAVMTDASGFLPALLLFGEEHNVCYLHAKTEDRGSPGQFHQTSLPYSSELRACVDDWGGLMSRPMLHFQHLTTREKDVNISTLATDFVHEQQLGLKASENCWAFQDYKSHTVLACLKASDLWDSGVSANTSAYQIEGLLTRLKSLNSEHEALDVQSTNLTKALAAMQLLLTHVVNNDLELSSGTSSAENGLLPLNITHQTMQLPDGKYVNIGIKISSTVSSALSYFDYDIHVTLRCSGAPKTYTYVFSSDAVIENGDKNLCVMLNYEDLGTCSDKKVNLNVFANIIGIKHLKLEEINNVLLHQLPILIAVHFSVLDVLT